MNTELKLSKPVELAVEQVKHVKEMLDWMLADVDACETENGVIGTLMGLDGIISTLEAAQKNIDYFQRTR